MKQIENINKIEYFKRIFHELEIYGIDVSNYVNILNEMILRYEENKKKEQNGEIYLSMFDWEMNLFMDLFQLENDLYYYILFLDLMILTSDWNINVDIDTIFYKVNDNFDKLVQNFCQIDLQKLVIEKYHDLLWKKILRDYKKDDFTYLDRYDDLKNYVYLQDSIRKYAECNDISCLLDQKLSNYRLKEIVNKISDVMKLNVEVIAEDMVEVIEQSGLSVVASSQNNFFLVMKQCLVSLFGFCGNYFRKFKFNNLQSEEIIYIEGLPVYLSDLRPMRSILCDDNVKKRSKNRKLR